MFARPMLRTTVRRADPFRRFESTAAEKATEAARSTASKAAEGLSRVTSAAGPAIAGAARGVTGALGRVGGRTGRAIGFIESMFWTQHHRGVLVLPLSSKLALGIPGRRWLTM
jgi:F-type H+-transporting ATPase subunit g